MKTIRGNQNPVAGADSSYEINLFGTNFLSGGMINSANVEWKLFRKDRSGRWIDITKEVKKGLFATFNFEQKAVGELIKIVAVEAKGVFSIFNNKTRKVGEIEVVPTLSKVPRINRVELRYQDDTRGTSFSVYERLRAKVYCTAMFGKEVTFRLWEDDIDGPKQGDVQTLLHTPLVKKVNSEGNAVCEFPLSKGLLKLALKGELDKGALEFYVTAEHFPSKRHNSNNAVVANPDHKATTDSKKQTTPAVINKIRILLRQPLRHPPIQNQ